MKNQKTNSKIAWAQALADSGALEKIEPQPQPDSTLTVIPAPIDEERVQAARSTIDPACAAVSVICSTRRNNLDSIEITEIFSELKAQAAAIQAGDLSLFDAMLVNQAVALQSLFADLAAQASAGTKSPEHREIQLKLALRAQNQSRATIQTLLESRNPRVFINHQANVSNGPQQVNNQLSHAGAPMKAPIAQIELSPNLEQNYDLCANDRTPIAAIAANTRHTAVETLDRAEDSAR